MTVTNEMNVSHGTTNSSTISREVSLPVPLLFVSGTILSMSVIVAVLGNALILFILVRHKCFTGYTQYLTVNLAFCDLTQALFITPMVAGACFKGRWISGELGCSVDGFSMTLLGFISIYSTMGIALDRCFAIKTAHKARNFKTSNYKQIFCVILVWLAAFIWALPPIFGVCGYDSEVIPVSCSYNFLNKSVSCVVFILSAVCAGFLIPLSATLVTYYMVYKAVVEYQEQIRQSDYQKGLRSKGRWKRRKMALATDVAQTSLTSMLLFCGSWLPYTVLALVTTFYGPSAITWFSIMPPILAKISTILHPVLCGLFDHRVRNKIFSIFGIRNCYGYSKENFSSTEQQFLSNSRSSEGSATHM